MNSKERVKAALEFRETDRTPIFDLIRNDKALEYYSGLRFAKNDSKKVVEKGLTGALDMTRSVRYPQEEEIIEKNGFSREKKRWTTWTKARPFKTLSEFASWVKMEIEQNSKWSEEDSRQTKETIESFSMLQQRMGDIVILWTIGAGPKLGHANRLEFFCYLYNDDPQLVSEWIRSAKTKGLKKISFLQNPAQVSPVAFVGTDIAGKNGPLFSPKFLEKEFFPNLKEFVDAYHHKGLKVLYHSDGNLMPILGDLVACGIDGLNPIETIAGMNIGKIRESYPKLFLTGGIDCSQLLPFGTSEQVKEVVKKTIKVAGKGYFVGSSSELHNDIPLENIKAMIEAAEEPSN